MMPAGIFRAGAKEIRIGGNRGNCDNYFYHHENRNPHNFCEGGGGPGAEDKILAPGVPGPVVDRESMGRASVGLALECQAWKALAEARVEARCSGVLNESLSALVVMNAARAGALSRIVAHWEA